MPVLIVHFTKQEKNKLKLYFFKLLIPKEFIKCVNFGSFASEGNFFLESWLTSHHFSLPIEPHYPTTFQTNPYSWSLGIRLHNFGSNLVQTTHFPQEIFSQKIKIVYLLCSILLQHFKKNLRDQIIRQSCIILAQIWPELPFPSKTNLFKKLTNI